MTTSRFYVALLALFAVLVPVAEGASGARLYFDIERAEYAVGSEFAAQVLIDSSAELNAYNMVISYPADLLEFSGLDTSRSIVDVRQDELGGLREGRVTLTGGSLQPFRGKGGEIMTLRFAAKKEGAAELAFINPAAYIADGKGTKAELRFENATVRIADGGAGVSSARLEDKTPPKIRILTFEIDPFNPRQRLLGFSVSDEGSGVKETMLRFRRWVWWEGWRRVTNPAPLPANAWTAELRVEDFQGNVSQEILYKWSALSGRLFGFGIAIFAVLAAVINRFLRRRRRYN